MMASPPLRALVVAGAMAAMALVLSMPLKQALLLGCVGGVAAWIIRLAAGGKNGK